MRLRQHLTAVAAAALLTVGLAPPATAGQSAPWTPVPDSGDYSVRACHTTITVHEKVNRVQSRTTTLRDGTVRVDYRGTYVVQVSTPDHRRVTLDNSGAYSEFDYPNGDTYYDLGAPGLIVYFDAVERAAFAKAGLPAVFYYSTGVLRLYVGDGYERVIARPRQVTSVCDLLHR